MTLDYLRLTGRDAARVALVEAYAQGAGPVPRRRRAGCRSTRRRSSSTSRRSSRASPARSGRRTACRSSRRRPGSRRRSRDAGGGRRRRRPRPAAGARRRRQRRVGAQSASPWPPRRPARSRRRSSIAAITSCTNTSNPSVMIGAGPAREEGGRARPDDASRGSRPAWRPGSKVVTEYLRRGRACSRTSTSSASTSSATAARPASATAARCPTTSRPRSSAREPGRRVGAERQPQLRGAHPAAGARELPRVAAARRRLRAGRHDDDRPDDRAARRRTGRQAGLPARHLADRARDSGDDAARRSTPRCSSEQYADVFDGDERWQTLAGADRRPLRLGAGLDLHPQPAVLRGHDAASRRRSPTSPARACWRCSATASRPITSRRPDRSRRTARPGST